MRIFKPGFHEIVRNVPITPGVSKNFETIRTTRTIGGFHPGVLNRWKSWKSILTMQVFLIVSIFTSSNKRTSYELQWKLVNTVTNRPKKKKKSLINGVAVLPGQAKISWLEGRNQKFAYIAFTVLYSLIKNRNVDIAYSNWKKLQAVQATPRHSITFRPWWRGLSFFSDIANTRYEHFCILFRLRSGVSRPNFLPITGIKVMISGITFDVSVVWERFHMIASKWKRK